MTVLFYFSRTTVIYNDKCIVLAEEDVKMFTYTQCTLFNEWSWKFGTTLGTGTLVFTPGSTFEAFPFSINLSPEKDCQLQTIGKTYHEQRKQLMLGMQLGLTKTYNLFHSNTITAQAVNEKDKQVAALQKHLEKTPNTISFNEAMQGILKLRELHVQIDEAVLDAYGWNDISLRHDFYEVDYLPENDRIRYTIHPDARKEVLKRLLELNHKIHAEEVEAGLFDKKPASKTKKGKKINPDQEELF